MSGSPNPSLLQVCALEPTLQESHEPSGELALVTISPGNVRRAEGQSPRSRNAWMGRTLRESVAMSTGSPPE